MPRPTGSPILWILAVIGVLAIVRETSIRRHAPDLYDWPSTTPQ